MSLIKLWFKGFLVTIIILVVSANINAQSKSLTNEDFSKPVEKSDLELLPGDISGFNKVTDPSLPGYVFYIPPDWSAGPSKSEGGFLPMSFNCVLQGPSKLTTLVVLADTKDPDPNKVKESIFDSNKMKKSINDPNNFKDKNKKIVTKQINGFDVTIFVVEEHPNQCRVGVIFESKLELNVLVMFGAVEKPFLPELGAIVHSVSKTTKK